MGALETVMEILQIGSSLIMVALILLQNGKGANLGASMSGGMTSGLLGPASGATFLSRSTAIAATVFFSTTLLLGYLSTIDFPTPKPQASVLDNLAQQASRPVSDAIADGKALRSATSPQRIPGQ
jgi:preprotein translocase subunit SecG